MRRTVATVALALCGPVWSATQVNEIRGFVVDSGGQPVALSSVTIARVGSDPVVTQTGRTETGGAYRLVNVAAGEYDLTIRASWFSEVTISDDE